jgi:hypothetical protein
MSTRRAADLVLQRESVRAMPTPRRPQVDDLVDAIFGHQLAAVAWMAGLAAGPAPTLLAAPSQPLFARQPIRRGWLRGARGILLPKSELMLQLFDALGLLSDLPIALGKLPTQTLDFLLQPFLGVCVSRPFRSRHALHGTPIASICTGP